MGCEKEEPVVVEEPKPELLPTNIYLSLEELEAPINVTHEDICDSYLTAVTRGSGGSAPDYEYWLQCGLFFLDSGEVYLEGDISLIYKGNSENLDPLSNMVYLLEKAEDEHTEEDPKLMPYLRIRYNNTHYTSTLFDRRHDAFGYTDPNKKESYTYEIKSPIRNCIDDQRSLYIDYQFSGYLYNGQQTDSIYIDSADMQVHTVIYGL